MKTSFSLFFAAAAAIACSTFTAKVHADEVMCPIMTKEAVDSAEEVTFEGVKLEMCCGKCVKLWAENPKYYAKAALELGLLPQLKGKEAELGLDKVELLEQRFCPFNPDTVVTPDSPSSEYKGKKVYFFNARAKKKWDENPDEAAKKAVEAGLLPQLKDA